MWDRRCALAVRLRDRRRESPPDAPSLTAPTLDAALLALDPGFAMPIRLRHVTPQQAAIGIPVGTGGAA